jgi:hypothetical protein
MPPLRMLGLVAMAACGGTAPRTTMSPSQPPPAASAGRPVGKLELSSAPPIAMPHELYMLIADGKTAHCQQWRVDTVQNTMSAHVVVAGRGADDDISFRIDGASLELLDYARTYSEDESASTTCTTKLDVHESDRGLLVGDATWFRTQPMCEAAIANHERVATELDCAIVEQAPANVQRATRTVFERVLARGGRLFSIVDGPNGKHCSPVRVRAARGGIRDVLQGDFEVSVVRDDGMKGTRALSYEYRRGADKITLLGPGTTWADGGAEAFG